MTSDQLAAIEQAAQIHLERCSALDKRIVHSKFGPQESSRSIVPGLCRQILELAALLRAAGVVTREESRKA